jgi:hypothetical protein
MINYRFMPGTPSRREAADPSILTFKDEYYIFASKSGGYYHSADLLHWTFIAAKAPLSDVIEKYAPAAVVRDNAIYFLTTGDRRLYRSGNPLNNDWSVVTSNFPFTLQDPDLFVDDDNRVYYYGGCSDQTPIIGCEINPTTWGTIGQQVNLISGHPDKNGWERMDDYNTGTAAPWIEGAFMQKHNSRYYLEYANPGTSFKAYNDAVYVSDHPLGPFTLAKHNPMSYLPEGFIAAAGHGSSTQDRYGNWWHIASMAIAVREHFERRLGLFPTFFDADGEMYAYTGFGDWPIVIPDKKISGPEDVKTGWFLLSYDKPTFASSSAAQHPPNYAVNENVRQWWSAKTGGAGEFLAVNLSARSTINAVQVNFADEGSTQLGRVAGLYYQFHIDVSTDNVTWRTIVDRSTNTDDLPHEYFQLDAPVEALLIRIVNVRTPVPMLFSLFGFRVFGKQGRAPPPAPANLAVSRHTDTRSVTLKWDAVAGAVGYNVRFGLDPKKLYHNYIAYSRTTLDINSLLVGHDYWFAVDAFNEGGLTGGPVVGPGVPTPSAPAITRVSAASWGTFPAGGPTADQTIQYTLANANAATAWTVQWRFDAEAFRAGAGTVVPGSNVYTFPRSAFTGARIAAGSHTASIRVTDGAQASSNVISVSYTVAGAAGARTGLVRAKVAAGGALAVASVCAAVYVARRRKDGGDQPTELADA